MPRFKVYISSTFLDMAPLRKIILELVRNRLNEWFEFTEVMEMMFDDAANRSDIDICLANVREADVYILLQGKRHGSAPDQYTNSRKEIIQNTEGKSYTWLEYEAACEIRRVKRNHIYKLELTGEFFNNAKLDPQSDLGDAKKKEYYDKFNRELSKTKSPVKINSIEELDKEVNVLLAKSYIRFNCVTQLQLTEDHFCSINRKLQVDVLLKGNLDPQSSVALLIVNSKNHEEDAVDIFSRKIRHIFRPNEIDEIKRNLEFVDLNLFSGSATEDIDKIRDKILVASSANIVGARASRISFDSLYKEIDKRNIQNRFLGYKIDLRMDSDLTKKVIIYLQDFIQYLDKFLNDNRFIFNFFVILSVVTDQDIKEGFIPTYMPGLNTELYDLKRLSDVELNDINVWLDWVLSTKNDDFIDQFNAERAEIIEQIFIDTRSFPKTYKQCLADIHSRAK